MFRALLDDEQTTTAPLVIEQPLTGLEGLAFPDTGAVNPMFQVLPDLFRILNSSTAKLLSEANSLSALHTFLSNFESVRALARSTVAPGDSALLSDTTAAAPPAYVRPYCELCCACMPTILKQRAPCEGCVPSFITMLVAVRHQS